jgi:hypothetical protein
LTDRFVVQQAGVVRLDTEQGIGVRFDVPSSIGTLQCYYPLEPLAEGFLKRYPPEQSNVAYALLCFVLCGLRRGLSIGLENVWDAARFDGQEMLDTVKTVAGAAGPKKSRKLREDTLARMDARTRLLVQPPETGPEAEVNVMSLSAALGFLLASGMGREQITVAHFANALKCSERAVYKALKKHGTPLERFIELHLNG